MGIDSFDVFHVALFLFPNKILCNRLSFPTQDSRQYVIFQNISIVIIRISIVIISNHNYGYLFVYKLPDKQKMN